MTVEARLDIDAVRRRFSALDSPLAFFDGPGGTQVPDEVIDAIARYLRESNANVGGPYGTSRATEALITQARLTCADFLGCTPEETIFGANMTTLNFALTRTAARELSRGDQVLVTRLDHDANVSPWLELEHDLGIEIGFVDIDDECRLDLDDLERQLTERTKVVAFPVASNAVGTLVDVPRVAELAHSVGALAWADAVHYAPHGVDRRRRVRRGRPHLLAVQVLRAAPRHGVRAARAARALAPVQGAPGAGGAARAPLRDGHASARAACRLCRGGRVHGLDRLGGDQVARERARRTLPHGPA